MREGKWITAVRVAGSVVVASGFLFLLLTSLTKAKTESPHLTDFGYGFNVDAWNVAKLQGMGFNSMKVFNTPGSRLPVNMLLRVDANVSHYNNLAAFGNSMAQLAQSQKGFVEAYEIGNEPNLDASYGCRFHLMPPITRPFCVKPIPESKPSIPMPLWFQPG